MDRHRDLSSSDRTAVLRVLYMQHGASLDTVALQGLADAIMPYVARSRRPPALAAEKIAPNYLRDGARVKQLMTEDQTPQRKHEWDRVLAWIIEFATKHTKYPKDTEAVSAPDLDAYDDVRNNIYTYNFEGEFDHWLTTAVTNRLARYWRDRQTLRAGGHGIRRGPAPQLDAQAFEREPAPNAYHLSFDRLLDGDMSQRAMAAPASYDVGGAVESAEFERIVERELRDLASTRNDPLLLAVWDTLVVRGLKLREAAEMHGLTISQVYRRMAQAQSHLQHSTQIMQWCDL